jgi:O-antigen/teichoic acid export membrane protein
MSIKKNTIWNLFGSGAPLLLGAFTIPYLLNQIGVELFGVLTIIWVLIGYFSFFDFGLGRALTQIISKIKLKNDNDYISNVASVGLTLIFALGIFGCILLSLVAFPLGLYWLNVTDIFKNQVAISLLIASIGIPLTTLTSGLKGILEAYLDFKNVNYLRFILGIGNFGFPALAVFMFGPDLTMIVVSLVVARFIVLILHIKLVSQYTKIKIVNIREHIIIVKEFIGFGSWMTLSNILSPLMVTSDRFIVSSIVGASLVAYYTVPFEILIRLLIIPAALTAALFPQITTLLVSDKEKAKELFYKCMFITFSVMFFVCVFVAIFSKVGIEWWLNNEFAEHSWYIASILTVGILFNSVAQIPHATVQASGNVKATSIAHLIEFIIYIPTLIISVHYFGLIGAVVTWVCRAGLDLFLMLFLARKALN